MEVFVLSFIILGLTILGMALGVILRGQTIKGSCGGLNAIAGADKCVVCQKEIDPNSPVRARMECPNRRRKAG